MEKNVQAKHQVTCEAEICFMIVSLEGEKVPFKEEAFPLEKPHCVFSPLLPPYHIPSTHSWSVHLHYLQRLMTKYPEETQGGNQKP